MSDLIAVAVQVPGLGLLTYRAPPECETPAPGVRVIVPLGARTVTGCVIGPADALGASGAAAKDVIEVLDTEPFLPRDVLDLALWAAEYYAAGPGETIASAMPPHAWVVTERRVTLTDLGRTRLAAGSERGTRAEVLEALRPGRPLAVKAVAGALAPRGGRTAKSATQGVRTVVSRLILEGLVAAVEARRGRASAFKTVRIVALTAQGADVVGTEAQRLGARQRDALALLAGSPDGLSSTALRRVDVSPSTVSSLVRRGLATVRTERVERDPFSRPERVTTAGPESAMPGVVLTEEQARAVGTLSGLVDSRTFHAVTLHGVTGSGKTEVYVRVAQQVRDQGRSVLILVPEIALTPAVAGRFRRAFGTDVAIQHSGLSGGERHDQWQRIRHGSVAVVVGTRSAVFTPLRDLGLIVVDEEHDTSYKQEESPRYHGRDVAVVRAQRSGAVVVLGSATPSLETHQNALDGRYTRVVLERRVLDRPLATVEVVDMREEYAAHGPDVILSSRLVECLDQRLRGGEQAMLLLNRRGFATTVFCRQCGETLDCPNCSVSLTFHRAARRARCHYCNHATPVPPACPHCGGPFLEHVGFGTERVEEAVRSAFPNARVARLDRDTVRRRGAATELLQRFADRDVDVMVGTQMMAKGHDFPAVTLVGVVSADVGLGLADFRASERTFQLLTQVAGRAGRGEVAGQAIVQTLHPGHYSIQHACRQDYAGFFEEEIEFRRTMRYPPTVALVNAVVRGRDFRTAFEEASSVVDELRRVPGFRVLGPAPAPIGKVRGEHRVQFFLKGAHRGVMRRALLACLERRPELRRRVSVDVDPLSVL